MEDKQNEKTTDVQEQDIPVIDADKLATSEDEIESLHTPQETEDNVAEIHPLELTMADNPNNENKIPLLDDKTKGDIHSTSALFEENFRQAGTKIIGAVEHLPLQVKKEIAANLSAISEKIHNLKTFLANL